MQRVRVVSLALMAMFVLGAFASATASAELPVILNAKKEVAGAVKFSGATVTTTELSILKGFGNVKCKEVKSEGEFEAKKPLGLFHINFGKCGTSIGGTCTGLGDEAEHILVLGSFHIVYDTLKPALGAAVLFLPEHVHFVCNIPIIGEKLILVLGPVLCLITPINTLAKESTIKCEKGKEAGDPGEVVYWDESGKEVNIKEGLLSSEDEGKTYMMSAQAGEAKITTTEEVEIMA